MRQTLQRLVTTILGQSKSLQLSTNDARRIRNVEEVRFRFLPKRNRIRFCSSEKELCGLVYKSTKLANKIHIAKNNGFPHFCTLLP
jgi:hypothetical protein